MAQLSGDGFLRCSDGRVRWGLFGAAGVVFVATVGSVRQVMIQQRSTLAHEGGTWSCAGGALDRDESPLAGALREAAEEVGEVPSEHSVLGQYCFAPATDWSYTTFVIEVPAPFGFSTNFETETVEWFPLDSVGELPMHAGFAAAWPHLKQLCQSSI